MIVREHYLDLIRPFYDTDLIKVITGIRRSGKSVILDQIRSELESKGCRCLKLDFEDFDISSEITSTADLIAVVKPYLGQDKLYLFLDEIQFLDGWNIACRSLRRENISIFITGSNSKLLSREFTKELSGRYVSFCIRPFVWKEIQAYSSQLGQSYSDTDYLVFGGFPKSIEFTSETTKLHYLRDLNETIILNDIIVRYHIRKTDVFKKLVNYILLSNSRVFSVRSIERAFRQEKINCSTTTLIKYIGYLEEAFVIRKMSLYSSRTKKELKYYTKLFDEDVSLNSIRRTGNRYDLSHNMENIVYNELVYRGYNVSLFMEENREIDFLAEKDGKEYLIQVALSVNEEKAWNREIALFNKLDNSRAKILITNDPIDYSTASIRHINFVDFLEMDSLDD